MVDADGGSSPFDCGDHCGICIYSDQKMNACRQRQTNGRDASLLRAENSTPSNIPAAPWEGRTGKWCGNQEAPPARVRGDTCSPWRISILFVSIFPPVISASPLQSQMANMAEGLAFVSKMVVIMDVGRSHPDGLFFSQLHIQTFTVQ